VIKYSLSEFNANQWWIPELKNIQIARYLTDDQYRATRVALRLAETVFRAKAEDAKILEALHAADDGINHDAVTVPQMAIRDAIKILEERLA
jgi:hypothetical protein